jgi:hypothetical protein
MKHRGWIVAGTSLALAAVLAAAAEKQGKQAAGPPPPLKVDRSAPLLLDEPKKDAKNPQAGPVADNSACHVCHTNYQEEPLALLHARADIGCVKCHGQSSAHRNDEDNITPPDVIYPASKIDAMCKKCHEEHNVPAAKVVARWQQRCPGKTDPSQIVCTDCHGDHRLKLRTVRWDKETRKLLSRKSPEAKKSAPAKE